MVYPDILALVMRYTTPPQTWQMKHGINIEPHHSSHPSPPLGDGGMSHFSERLYKRDLGFWVGTGTLGGGDFFSGGV